MLSQTEGARRYRSASCSGSGAVACATATVGALAFCRLSCVVLPTFHLHCVSIELASCSPLQTIVIDVVSVQKEALEQTEEVTSRARALTMRIREEELSLTHNTVSLLMNHSLQYMDQLFGTLSHFFLDEDSVSFRQFEVRTPPSRHVYVFASESLMAFHDQTGRSPVQAKQVVAVKKQIRDIEEVRTGKRVWVPLSPAPAPSTPSPRTRSGTSLFQPDEPRARTCTFICLCLSCSYADAVLVTTTVNPLRARALTGVSAAALGARGQQRGSSASPQLTPQSPLSPVAPPLLSIEPPQPLSPPSSAPGTPKAQDEAAAAVLAVEAPKET